MGGRYQLGDCDFCGGTDADGLGPKDGSSSLVDFLTEIVEAANKPSVAAIDGLALGGWRACHAKIMTSSVQLGTIKTAILVGTLDIGFLAGLMMVTSLAMKGDVKIDAVGFACAGVNIVMYGSPLAAMRRVVSTKSVEYMPFFLSFFLFLNGGIWSFYAFLVLDYFLLVPNGIGFLLGIAQLVLFAIYWNAKPVTVRHDDSSLLEERLVQADEREPLIASSNSHHQP